MKPELRKALDQLRAAVEDEGPQPEYHRCVKREMEAKWPSLMKAVQSVLRASK